MPPIAILAPYSSGCELIDAARADGHEPVVLAGHGALPPQLRPDDRVVRVETDDPEAVDATLVALHRERPLAAVLPGFEDQVPAAARLAAALGLPGLEPEVSLRVRYKDRMRRALAASGVAQPRFRIVSSAHEAATAGAYVGLPCVVKPIGRSGSAGVRKAASVAEAAEALHHLVGPGAARPDAAAMVEEYIDGPEFSIEGYVDGGRIVVLGITEKLLGPEPCFVEIGHIFPAELPDPVAAAIRDYIVAVVRALGISLGPFHAEIRLGAHGPRLMEVAARLPGDRIPALLALTLGVDLPANMLRGYLGRPAQDPRPAGGAAQGMPCAGVRFFLRPGVKRYRRVDVDRPVAGDSRVRELAMLIAPGARVPPADSSRGRLGYAVVTAERHDELRALLELADGCVHVSTQPRNRPRRHHRWNAMSLSSTGPTTSSALITTT
jgi:biotin carboxylase